MAGQVENPQDLFAEWFAEANIREVHGFAGFSANSL